MPIQPHPVFLMPDDQAPLSRYMSLPKFIDFVSSSSLYFARLTELRHQDPYEGHFTDYMFDLAAKDFVDLPDEEQRFYQNAGIWEVLRGHDLQHGQLFDYHSYLNCWYTSQDESTAMWHMYGQGVCIRSSYPRVSAALSGALPNVHAGLVTYINYDSEKLPSGNDFYRMMHKRKPFASEEEFRMLLLDNTGMSNYFSNGRLKDDLQEILETTPPGIHVPVDLIQLVERIIISPLSHEGFEQQLYKLIVSYGYDIPVVKSGLAKRPRTK